MTKEEVTCRRTTGSAGRTPGAVVRVLLVASCVLSTSQGRIRLGAMAATATTTTSSMSAHKRTRGIFSKHHGEMESGLLLKYDKITTLFPVWTVVSFKAATALLERRTRERERHPPLRPTHAR
jgi:hypothetical protein